MSKSEIEKRIYAAWNEAFDHGEQQGADLERRRIRRALRPLLMRLKSVSESALDETDGIFWRNSVEQLDAATRAVPRKKK